MIESSHTPEECLTALDEMLAKGPDILEKFVWGCSQGEHTGWAYVDAKNKEDEVSKFSPEQIRSFHEE